MTWTAEWIAVVCRAACAIDTCALPELTDVTAQMFSGSLEVLLTYLYWHN